MVSLPSFIFGITYFEFRWLRNKGHYDTYDVDPD